MHEPFGGIGASLLIQAAITAYFDFEPARRAAIAQYPEIYIFSVDGSQGDHTMFDFWPPRKDVVLGCDPIAVLEAINDRAITRLAVPDGTPVAVDYAGRTPAGWSETNSAIDRVTSAFTYSPSGIVSNPDITLTATSTDLESNPALALDPNATMSLADGITDEEWEQMGPHAKSDAMRYIEFVARRAGEYPAAVRTAVARRRQAIVQDGLATENYRRIPVADALGLLVPLTDRLDSSTPRRPEARGGKVS
ncbi:hypothetical protein ACQP1G_21810 [Nocardia sp. CA-107356]|uniref:hypothetical protein n=1 Tax=Nocardia sp. CA-107356 TaxID=3239972 RepID=UPI003D8DE1CA